MKTSKVCLFDRFGERSKSLRVRPCGARPIRICPADAKHILWILFLMGSFILSSCGSKPEPGLTIDSSALTEEPSFIDWEEDGTAMQLLARKDADGKVYLAYNTCQSCNGSPYAYFVYLPEENALQCQNCGLTFPVESINAVTNKDSCNPYPLSQYSEEGGVITISKAALSEGSKLFKGWKQFEE